MKKKIFCIIAAVCVCLSLSACAADTDEYQSQISDLQQSYSDLQSQLEDLQSKLAENEDEALKLQQEIDLLTAQVQNLSGNPVSYTATAPVYSARDGDIQYADFDHHDDDTVSFESFYKYCSTNFINNEFYLLAPIASEYDIHPNIYRNYSVFAQSVENNVAVNPMFFERIMIYSDILGDGNYYPPDTEGYIPWSVDLKLYSMPIENLYDYDGYSLNFKFGQTESGGDWTEYVNISLGGNTFATCYYRTNAFVSSRWLEEYFTENLIAVKNDFLIK